MNRASRWLFFSISQALFGLAFGILFLSLFNGYLLNLVSGRGANPWLVLAGVLVEALACLWASRNAIRVQVDALELAGWIVVVLGVWLYLVVPSLPTLLPPTRSMDAVKHYEFILFSYPDGRLVSWYPAGGAFLAATFAHWLGLDPLRILHPLAAALIALSAGGVYGMTCGLLPNKPLSKITALAAPALLFVPWSYFAGIVDWEQYFYAQAVAQYFVVAAVWFTMGYAVRPHWVWLALLAAALLGTVAAYPYLVGLPLALFAMVAIGQAIYPFVRKTTIQGETPSRFAIVALVFLLALMALAAIVLQQGGILEWIAGAKSLPPDVGEGGVTKASLDTLGGPLFLLLSLIGMLLAWRSGAQGKTLVALVGAWLLQWAVLMLVQPLLQISGYRVDKTFYILVFPLAILAALPLAHLVERWKTDLLSARRARAVAWPAVVGLLSLAIALLRPPIAFSPLTEPELQAALWAKDHLDTFQISYLNRQPISAYWLAFGLWGETLPNEWFQWLSPGAKLGPRTLQEWLNDPAWPQWVLVSDLQSVGPGSQSGARIVYQIKNAAILEKASSPQNPPSAAHVSGWQFGNTLKLVGYDLAGPVLPGASLTLTTVTESLYPPPATVGWRVELIDRHGNVLSKATGEPFAGKYPLQRWPSGRFARDVWELKLDPPLAPGAYSLQMGLYRTVDGQPIDAAPMDPATGAVVKNQASSAAVPLTKLRIPVPPPSAEELESATPLEARVGHDLVLARYSLHSDRAARTVHLTLYWRSTAKTDQDYTVFAHVLDSAGKVIAQVDLPPRGGDYPTSLWEPGEIIKDAYDLRIPDDAPAPPYSIEVGMYSYPGVQRLAAGGSDHLLLPLPY